MLALNKRRLLAFSIVVMLIMMVQPLLGCCEQCSCEGCSCDSCGCSSDSDDDGSDASEDTAASTETPSSSPQSCTPTAEVQDSRDNDCDGSIDEIE